MPTLTQSHTPTYSPTQATHYKIISDLEINSDDCELPCFWGITPGETSWDYATNLLSSISVRSNYSDREIGMEKDFLVQADESLTDTIIAILLYSEDTTIDFMVITGLSVYRLPQVLDIFGEPSEIWVEAISNPLPNSSNTYFYLILFYPEEGIRLFYGSAISGKVIEDTIHGCIDEGPFIQLWNAQEVKSMFDPIHPAGKPLDWNILPIEEAVGMSVEEFHHAFVASNEPICVDTPRELWED
jgi:hypothetical protein